MRRTPLAVAVFAAVLVAACLSFAVGARAQDADAPPEDATARFAGLEAQVEALRAEVEFLRAREASLTKAALAQGPAADDLLATVRRAREAGFEGAAIPAASRQALLRGIEQLAGNLASALPAPTDAEKDLERRAAQLRK
jgi:hypothetical protein